MMRIALTLTFLLAGGAGLQAQGEPPAPKQETTKGTTPKPKAAAARKQARLKARAAAEAKRLDLNTATKAQLEKLPGVTPAYADQIIAHRPYLTNEHLVINKAVPESVYFSIRSLVTARPPKGKAAPAPAPARKPAK
ncbi:MAG TPA: helix-hairpin-helix domain-containing protein [Holophagaceae bacterium]